MSTEWPALGKVRVARVLTKQMSGEDHSGKRKRNTWSVCDSGKGGQWGWSRVSGEEGEGDEGVRAQVKEGSVSDWMELAFALNEMEPFRGLEPRRHMIWLLISQAHSGCRACVGGRSVRGMRPVSRWLEGALGQVGAVKAEKLAR